MSTTRLLRFLSILLIAVTLTGGGCVFRARARPVWVVDVAPPAPRVVEVRPRPGWVWIEGHWERIRGRWIWRDGHWVRERAGHVWTPGVWVEVHGRWEWRAGRWEPRPKVRDHR